MVKIPKFYIKDWTPTKGPLKDKPCKFISPYYKEGFRVHPAFLNNKEELDCFYLGAFKGSLSSNKICSVAGVKPAVSINFNNFKTYCSNRGTGWMMSDIYQRAAIQWLMLVEYANPDMQVLLGNGHVSGSSAANVDATTNSNWRGLVGLWGNVWEMTDGVKADTNKYLNIFKNNGSREYASTGLYMVIYDTPASWTGWISEMFSNVADNYNLNDVFIPSKRDFTKTNGTYGDNQLGTVANGVNYVGGCWLDSSNAGLFCCNFCHVASDSYNTTGVRLAKI